MSREQQKGPARGAGWDMGHDRARSPAPRSQSAQGLAKRRMPARKYLCYDADGRGRSKGSGSRFSSSQPVGVVCLICQSESDMVIVCDQGRHCYIRHLIC
jgi:hypothetical protein